MAEVTDLAFLAARILLGGYFLMAAAGHLFGAKNMIGYAQMKGVPAPALAIYGTGILLLVAGASIATGFLPLVGIGAAAVFFLGVTPKMHDFWNQDDPMAKMTEQIMFMKNWAILAGTIGLLGAGTNWPLSL